MKRIASLAVVLALATVGCSSNKTTTTAGPTKVTVKTTEYGFSAPASFKGGLVELTIDNAAGKEHHEAELNRVDAGKTAADVKAALEAGGAPPAWLHSAGGPGPVPPGKSAVYTANLEAGTYVFVCHIPARDGKEHYTKGMVGETQVTAGTNGTLPAADATLTTTEFKFNGTESLKAGSQTVRVTNAGKQSHHIAIFALAPGKKVADLAAFFGATAPSGPPPFTGIPGLIAGMSPGLDATRTLDLAAGATYVFVCFIPDTDGKPHFTKGMVAELTL